MVKWMNISNIYMAIWCVFNVTFKTRNMLSRPLFVILFIITIYYIFIAVKNYKFPLYLRGLSILLLMFFIYGVELILSDKTYFIEFVGKKVDNPVYIITVFKSLCPIFPFFVFAKKGFITDSFISFWLCGLFCTTLVTFFLTYEQMLLASRIGRTEFVNNQGYSFAGLIPFLFLLKSKNWIKYIILGVIMIFVFLSMKRGAIILAGISFLFFLYKQIANSEKNKIPIIFSVIILICIAFFSVSYFFETNAFFASRVQDTLEGNSSHRDDIYTNLLFIYANMTPTLNQIIGSGANFTLSVGENYAHNDWLELLINNGLVGIICYLYYWFMFYKNIKLMKDNKVLTSALLCSMLFMFLKSFFSMSYGEIGTGSALCVGYCLGSYKKELNHNL